AVAIFEGFARDQLVAADDALGAAEIDDDIAIFDPLDRAVDDLADAILVFLVLPVALGLAHLLHDDLLGRLGGNAAIIDLRQLFGDGVADLRVGLAQACRVERDLRRRILDLLDHFQQPLQLDLAGAGIDLGADIGLLTVARASRLLDGVGHGLDHDRLVDRLLTRNRVRDLDQFEPVGTYCHGLLLWIWRRTRRSDTIAQYLVVSSAAPRRHVSSCVPGGRADPRATPRGSVRRSAPAAPRQG